MSEYLENVRSYSPTASEAAVASSVKYCGIALHEKGLVAGVGL